jgi:transcription elongation factor Elf1
MLWIDAKYIGLISYKLRNFKQRKAYYWNFSCPICGDSKKNPLKARGFVYQLQNGLIYKCHNCGYSSNLGNLIKHLDPMLYNEYVLERYKTNTEKHVDHVDFFDTTIQVNPEPVLSDSILDSLSRVDRLPDGHIAKEYVRDRKIPEDKWSLLYYADKFKEWSNKNKQQFEAKTDSPRLVIPFFNKHGKCFMYQGRAFDDEQPKYIAVKIDESEEKVYGLDRVDYSKRVYAVEGPIDAIFLPNTVAVGGAGFDIPYTRSIKSNITLVMDNEPRNKEIVKQLGKYVQAGYSICMWPDTVKEKDINEMVLAGKSIESIMETINTNTFTGLSAQLRFNDWKKV